MSNGIKLLLIVVAIIAVFVFVPGFFNGIKMSCSNVFTALMKTNEDINKVEFPSLKGD